LPLNNTRCSVVSCPGLSCHRAHRHGCMQTQIVPGSHRDPYNLDPRRAAPADFTGAVDSFLLRAQDCAVWDQRCFHRRGTFTPRCETFPFLDLNVDCSNAKQKNVPIVCQDGLGTNAQRAASETAAKCVAGMQATCVWFRSSDSWPWTITHTGGQMRRRCPSLSQSSGPRQRHSLTRYDFHHWRDREGARARY
jgi:hypothetical protein